MRPPAVLWDMDGTLVDSEPIWLGAMQTLAARHGVTWTVEDALTTVGLALPAAGAILQATGIDLAVAEIVDVLVEQVRTELVGQVPWQPGARELIGALAEAGVPQALVTMSYRPLANCVAADTPDGAFATVVTGEQVRHGKPHPEPYLTAARELGVDPRRCVVIEDSPTGMAAAEAAGARVVVVTRLLPIPAAKGRSRIASLAGLTVDDLGRVAAGEVIDRVARAS